MAFDRFIRRATGRLPAVEEVVAVADQLTDNWLATRDPARLPEVAAAWERAVIHPELERWDPDRQAQVLQQAGEMTAALAKTQGRPDAAVTAVGYLTRAVVLTTPQSGYAPLRLYACAGGLRVWYRIASDPKALDQAIDCYERALDPSLPGGRDAGAIREALADALRERFDARRNQADLDRAIALMGG